jgi:hypothetical protein
VIYAISLWIIQTVIYVGTRHALRKKCAVCLMNHHQKKRERKMTIEIILPALTQYEWARIIVCSLMAILFGSFSAVFIIGREGLGDVVLGIIFAFISSMFILGSLISLHVFTLVFV